MSLIKQSITLNSFKLVFTTINIINILFINNFNHLLMADEILLYFI